MGSSSKKTKDKDRKKRHRSRSVSVEREVREKKHKHHKKHHKKEKKEKAKHYEYESDSSDVVEIVTDEHETVSAPPPPKIQRTHSPEIGHGQSVESLSIEETNKLRAKLGLKPLQVDNKSDSKEDREDGKKKDDLGEFYHKPAENLSAKQEQEKLREKIAHHKEKRHLDQKLSKVKLLSEQDSDDDTLAWVEKNRKIVEAKKEAEKRAKMLEELDAQFGVGEIVESEQRLKKNLQYTEKHLKGLEVQHDTESIKEGQTLVLTLKDRDVLDETEDTLVNVNLLDEERYKKNVENKKRKPDYNPYDVEEVDEFGNLKPKSLLSKYDSEIEGPKKESFRIGFDNAAERKQVIMNSVKEKLANKRIESLQMPELTIASDYYSEQELEKFKKPKKKVKKLRSKPQTTVIDDEESSKFYTRRPKVKEDPNIIDTDDLPPIDIKPDIKIEDDQDDTLEKALHKARKLKQRESVAKDIITPAALIKEEPPEEDVDQGKIVLNTTAEFCRTLGDIPTYGKSGNREDTEELIDFEKDTSEDMEIDTKDEELTGWNAVDPTRSHEAPSFVPAEVPILDEEPDVGSGVGAALKLAMSKGYLEKEDKARPSNSKLAHLQAQHYSIEDKSYGDDLDRGARRERYAGPIMDFKEKETFKPNVKLEYIDDEGHVLNAKEAFRYLSHKFHGKGPGKNKIEKRLKKQQQEGLMKKMSSTDTPLGTLNMLQQKQKEMQSPFIVLSGGKHTHSTTIAKPR